MSRTMEPLWLSLPRKDKDDTEEEDNPDMTCTTRCGKKLEPVTTISLARSV